MARYSITAPNGQTYEIDGPANATQDQVQAEVMRQFPEAVGAGDPFAYLPDLQKKFDAGASVDDLTRFAQEKGLDSSFVGDMAHLVDLRNQGRKVVFQPDKQPEVADASLGQRFMMGVGDVVQGIADIPGLLANPLNAALNWTGIPQAIMGEPLATDLGQAARDAIGAPEPVTDSERYASMINRGGSGAVATAGAALPVQAARGTAGSIARTIAENPVRDLIAGITGGAGSEGGGDAGEAIGRDIAGDAGASVGRTAGNIAGGLAGGIGGISAHRRAEQMAEAVAAKFPRAVLLDGSGNLTEEGLEIAHRTGASPDGIARFARLREAEGPVPNRGSQARREALRSRPRSEAPFRPDERVPEPAPPASADGAQLAPESGGSGDQPPRSIFEEAGEEGIPLTRGQAERDFEVQNDENSLRVSATKEGNRARLWFQAQAEAIKDAASRFRQSIGPDAGGAAERGQVLKDAIRDLRDAGREGVRTLYREAEAMGGEELALPTQGIHDAATDVLIDEAVPEGVKRAVAQELARYGIIGEAASTNEAGLTKVALDDGSSVTFRGPVKQLTAANAEELRQAINRLYDPTKPELSGQSIKPAIDDALEDALTAASGREGGIGAAYARARDAHRAQKEAFQAKDIIENLIAAKKGTQTDVVLPERAIAQVLGNGPEGLSNLRRVRNLLLSRPTPSSQQAWAAIKHQALADIFDAALARNSNTGGEIVETISGAKLRTAIFDKFGAEKLRIILDPQEFSRLMRLQRVIGHATIPMTGTTNPSGTFTKIVNYLRAGVLRTSAAVPGLNLAVDASGNLLRKAKELSATRKTLEGITAYRGPESSRRMDRQARDFVRQYIEDGKAGRLMPATVSLGASNGDSP